MIARIKAIIGKKYYPLNKITISESALIGNYRSFCKFNSKITIAPVLKSNAYGHGAKSIAKILDHLNPPFVCVDSLYEAYQLKKIGLKNQILITGYIDPKNLKIKRLPFAYVVYSLDQLKTIAKYQPNAQVHIKVDTGMHRMGIPISELANFIDQSRKIGKTRIVGLMSHFAMADEPQSSLTLEQIENFKIAEKVFQDKNINLKWKHIAATDGLANIGKIENYSNLARIGIGLYGLGTKKVRLRPVLELKSQIAQIKKLKKGDHVGYSGTFTAKNKTVLGILPIGYNDGLDRRLSNRGFVKVRNKFCPIVGRISMNIATIDITKIKNPLMGEEVLIFSKNASEVNSLENTAKICSTIPHDILVHLNPTSIRRELVP